MCTIIDCCILCKWANLQNQLGAKLYFPHCMSYCNVPVCYFSMWDLHIQTGCCILKGPSEMTKKMKMKWARLFHIRWTAASVKGTFRGVGFSLDTDCGYRAMIHKTLASSWIIHLNNAFFLKTFVLGEPHDSSVIRIFKINLKRSTG